MSEDIQLEPGLVSCKFTSVWDSGVEINSNATYDPATGYIEVGDSDSQPGHGDCLVKEYITLPDEFNTELEVCNICHEYVLETVMGRRDKQCRNPDCENR